MKCSFTRNAVEQHHPLSSRRRERGMGEHNTCRLDIGDGAVYYRHPEGCSIKGGLKLKSGKGFVVKEENYTRACNSWQISSKGFELHEEIIKIPGRFYSSF